MSQAYSGEFANFINASTDIDMQSWSIDIEVNTFDSTTTADAGWDDTTPATKKLSGTVDFFYNPSKKPTGSTANFTPGSIGTFTCYINKSLDPGDILTGQGLVTKLSFKAKVKDGFLITASFVNKGPWTLPS